MWIDEVCFILKMCLIVSDIVVRSRNLNDVSDMRDVVLWIYCGWVGSIEI